MEVVQLASVALSDGLQMADDLIRDTLQRSTQKDASSPGLVAPVDSAVVKLAVQKSAKQFGLWLASALEQLVGCEPSSEEDDVLLEVWEEEEDEDGNDSKQKLKRIIMPKLEQEEKIDDGASNRWLSASATSYSRIDSAAAAERQNSMRCEATSNLIIKLIVQLEDASMSEEPRAYCNFLLAICEMCRLAERSMANTLNQSIQSAMMEDDAHRVAADSTLFGDVAINPHRKGRDDFLDEGRVLSARFQLAASRALSMYVMYRGAHCASELCARTSPPSPTRGIRTPSRAGRAGFASGCSRSPRRRARTACPSWAGTCSFRRWRPFPRRWSTWMCLATA